MAIMRARKRTNPYVMIDKHSLTDETLSWAARGMLVTLLSFPDDWDVYMKDLIKRTPDGKHTAYRIMNELKNAGYVKHSQQRGEGGKHAGSVYDVFEIPAIEDEGSVDNYCPDPEKPHPDIRDTEKRDPVYRDADPRDPVDRPLVNNKVTNDQNNKEINSINQGRAQNSKAETSASIKNKHELIDDDYKKFDELIGDSLTPGQLLQVDKVVAGLIAEMPQLGDPQALRKDIVHDLLNPNKFSMAENKFRKKLHSLRSAIRRGKWFREYCAGHVMTANQAIALPIDVKNVLEDLFRHRHDYDHWLRMRSYCENSKDESPERFHSCQQEVEKAEQAIAALEDELNVLLAQHSLEMKDVMKRQ